MKLRYGKGDWLELQPVSLESQRTRAGRMFALASDNFGPNSLLNTETGRLAASRASVVTNSVVQHVFQKMVSPLATQAVRAVVQPDRVEPAVFYDPSGTLRVVYREVVVRFEPNTPEKSRKAVLEKFGLEVRDKNAFHGDQLIAVDPTHKYVAERVLDLANQLNETDEIAFAFPNFVSEFKRSLQVPQPVAGQWHLARIGARTAWNTTQGENVVVAVLDDGVDIDHPNLKPNIKKNPDPSELRDKFGRDFFVGEDAPDHFDPRPKQFTAPFDQMPGNDIHGTCCAGVAAASGKAGVCGIAPKAQVLPVKIFHADDLATESRVANAIRYASRFADVLSCSWAGPPSPDIQFAIEEAAGGRGGKGCPVFCATGNETASVGFPARLAASIAVGASTDGQALAFYSNRGTEVSIVAPSNGGTKAIFTTDVSVPNRGFNLGTIAAGGADGLNTNGFGGTSSATPLTAGIAALVLSANPSLSRDDVRKVLQDTAVKIGPPGSYGPNGHSNDFGFGEVSAARAVAQAASMPGAAARLAAPPPRRPPSAARKAPKGRAAKKVRATKPAKARKSAKRTRK
jgi:subtilisin family serine protease